ncbi:heterokaryon incompatibility protein-domain-containing protein [Rhypophila decipiens]|uniref:Heterokaryon incompatibility protein-domain-containing protein n=1 Tax=Rhypophila decipiens TaxID=261697 RepID=A0AAN7AZH4_9PEZI|nr:heterokaryon incompatibility protein-domain-containing protein [Rhypophila decipiens]
MKVFLSPDEGGAFADVEKAPFPYDALPDGRRWQTRVLTLRGGKDMTTIECWLDALDLDDTGLEYEALSYCWGDAEHLTPIYCNGRRFDVTPNLKMALNNLRPEQGERRLWVDAICTNQKDKQECARQVPKMGEIYGRAAMVVVWLGEVWEAYMTAFDIFRYLAGVYDEQTAGREMKLEEMKARVVRLTMEGYPTSMSFKLAFHIVQKLEAVPYFSRMWVLQEIALAQSVTLVAGHQTLPWESFQKAMLVRALYATQDRRLRKVMFRHLDHGALKLVELRMAVAGSRQDRSILTLMNQFRGHKATEAADKVYAILDLTDTDKDDIGLRVDYSLPTAALYTDLAKGILLKASAGGLDLLSVPRVNSKLVSEMPSWVPDWSHDAEGGARPLAATVTRYGSGTFCASGRLVQGQKAMCDFIGSAGHQLLLRGYVVDRIEHPPDHVFPPALPPRPSARSSSSSSAPFQKETSPQEAIVESTSTPAPTADTKQNQDPEKEVRDTRWPEQMSTNTYPPTNEMLGISYLRTICADSFPPLLVNLDSDLYKMLFMALDHWLDQGTGYPHGMWGLLRRLEGGLPEVEFPQLRPGEGIDLCGMMDTMLGRRLMWTRDGYFGAVPAEAREGDAIVLVEGSRVPLVLRSVVKVKGSGEVYGGTDASCCWQLVGDCFMHGAMYGERWDRALCGKIVLV